MSRSFTLAGVALLEDGKSRHSRNDRQPPAQRTAHAAAEGGTTAAVRDGHDDRRAPGDELSPRLQRVRGGDREIRAPRERPRPGRTRAPHEPSGRLCRSLPRGGAAVGRRHSTGRRHAAVVPARLSGCRRQVVFYSALAVRHVADGIGATHVLRAEPSPGRGRRRTKRLAPQQRHPALHQHGEPVRTREGSDVTRIPDVQQSEGRRRRPGRVAEVSPDLVVVFAHAQ